MGTPGSALVSSAGGGVSPPRTFSRALLGILSSIIGVESSFRRDAETSPRDEGAPRNSLQRALFPEAELLEPGDDAVGPLTAFATGLLEGGVAAFGHGPVFGGHSGFGHSVDD